MFSLRGKRMVGMVRTVFSLIGDYIISPEWLDDHADHVTMLLLKPCTRWRSRASSKRRRDLRARRSQAGDAQPENAEGAVHQLLPAQDRARDGVDVIRSLHRILDVGLPGEGREVAVSDLDLAGPPAAPCRASPPIPGLHAGTTFYSPEYNRHTRNARQLDVAVGLTKPKIESAKYTYEDKHYDAEGHQ